MTDVQPRARTRPAPVVAVSPPPRTRPAAATVGVPVPQARERVRSAAEVIPDAKALGVLQQTHNGHDWKRLGGQVDPRFAPLIIVMNPSWLKELPGYISFRLEESLKWTAASVAAGTGLFYENAFFSEWGLRHYIGKALLDDDVYEALERWLVAHYDKLNLPARAMAKVVENRLEVDMTKSAGPFYCDALIGIEHHYAKHLRLHRPG